MVRVHLEAPFKITLGELIMAIRIIKNGKYAKITCDCGCEYAFDKVDIEEDGMVPCPQCDARNKPEVKEN